MSRWLDAFKQHPFQNILLQFNNGLSSYKVEKDADTAAVAEYSRIRKVVKYISAVNAAIDPELISTQVLNEMQGQLLDAFSQFTEYTVNKNLGNLQNANNSLDYVLNVISKSFVYYKKPTKNVLSDIVQTYTEVVSQHQESYKLNVDYEIDRIGEKSGEIASSLAEAGSEVATLKDELKNIQNQIQTILAEFNTQFQNSQSALQQRADAAIDSANKKFESQVETVDKRVAIITQRSHGEFKGLLDRSQQKANEEFVGLTTKATTILGILQRLQDDAEAVFGVIQNTVQAGAHKRYADEERATANWYRYGAICLMLLSVGILVAPEIWNYLSNEAYKLDWSKIVDRLPISIIVFAPAFYLARESSKHRQNEFQNRRRELTLRTIDPYLALLGSETQRDELKGQIAKSIFAEDKVSSGESADIATHIVSILDNISKFLSRKG